MNERIKELAEQAGIQEGKSFLYTHWNELSGHSFDKQSLEKFTELIVRECVKEMCQQMYWHRIDQSNNPNFYKAVDKTLKHFGVEE